MSKETPKIDVDMINEFGRMMQAEARTIEPEERLRKTLWALDTLKQENRINSETTLEELIRIIEERKRELRQTAAYAKDTARAEVAEEMGTELRAVAKKEVATAERLVSYMEAASSELILMRTKGRDPETPLSQIRERLEGELEIMETAVDRSEEAQRHENKKVV